MQSTAPAGIRQSVAIQTRQWQPILPPELIFDSRLSGSALRLAFALETFARNKVDAWPTNKTLAELTGQSISYIRCDLLPQLEKAGWIARIHDPGQPGRRRRERGEVIQCLWNSAQAMRLVAAQGDSPASGGGDTRVSGGVIPEHHRSIQREVTKSEELTLTDNGNYQFSPSREEKTPDPEKTTAQEPPGAIVAAQAGEIIDPAPEIATGQIRTPVTMEQAMAELQVAPQLVNSVAGMLADDLQDQRSFRYFAKVCRLVATAQEPVDRLRAAYRAALGSKGTSTAPGRVFVSRWKAWIPRSSPEDATSVEPTPEELARWEEIEQEELKKIEQEDLKKSENLRERVIDLATKHDIAIPEGLVTDEQWEGFRRHIYSVFDVRKRDRQADLDRAQERQAAVTGQTIRKMLKPAQEPSRPDPEQVRRDWAAYRDRQSSPPTTDANLQT
jgi:hypothetical protein